MYYQNRIIVGLGALVPSDGAIVDEPDAPKSPPPLGSNRELSPGERLQHPPIRCPKCRARIYVVPCRACTHQAAAGQPVVPRSSAKIGPTSKYKPRFAHLSQPRPA